MLTQKVYTIGTASTTVVEPTPDLVNYALKNLEPFAIDDYARDGRIYLVNQQFTVANNGEILFSILTGNKGMQIDFYEISTEDSAIFATLVEGATITTTGDLIPVFNLNRNFPDTISSQLRQATAITGGTITSAEFLSATNQSSANLSLQKIHTLKPNTQYGFRFLNQGTQSTRVFFQLGFSEQYNGYNNIWLNTLSDSYCLKAGDELQMQLLPNEIINAVTLGGNCKLAVMRQE